MSEADQTSRPLGHGGRARFVHGPTMRHVVVMSTTGSVGLMATFATDFLNLLYISLLGETELAAAIGFAGSLLFVTISLSVGFGIAASALAARAHGEGDLDQARRRSASSITLALLATVLLTLLLMPLLGPILSLLGASGRTYEVAHRFILIVFPTFPILAVSIVLAGLLRAVGDARRAMYVTLAGAATTAVLDPILIFGLGLGVDGAAIASVVSRLALLATGLYGLVRVHRMVARPTLAHVREDFAPIMAIAGPAILTQVATPVANAYLTASIAPFGDGAVAAWAIIWRLIPVAFGGIFALSGAIGPILAQNLGAQRHERIRRALTDALIVVTLYVAVVWFILWLGQNQIVAMFGARGQAAELIRFFCTWVAGTFLFFGALFVANAAFNSLGFPTFATFFNWGRATLGTIPFVMIGSAWYGAEGVIAGQGLGSVVFGSAAIFTAYWALDHLRGRRPGSEPPPIWRFALPPFISGKGGTAAPFSDE